jgi:hypothetical protein
LCELNWTATSVSAEYRIRAKVWLYPGKAGWHFATVPAKQSAEIRARFGADARGWGSLPATIRVGRMEWSTSLFPERKSSCYLFPIKAEVRKKEDISAGDSIVATVKVR